MSQYNNIDIPITRPVMDHVTSYKSIINNILLDTADLYLIDQAIHRYIHAETRLNPHNNTLTI